MSQSVCLSVCLSINQPTKGIICPDELKTAAISLLLSTQTKQIVRLFDSVKSQRRTKIRPDGYASSLYSTIQFHQTTNQSMKLIHPSINQSINQSVCQSMNFN